MMTGMRVRALCCLCLLLMLAACGNKGPLVLPEEDPKKKTRSSSN